MSEKNCDIIIPVFNKPDLTLNCLRSVQARTRSPHRIIIIDNNSDPETKRMLEDFKATSPNVIVITNRENVGWVKAVNQGIEPSSAPYICFMNNDTIVRTDDWLTRLIGVADLEPDIGLVNPMFDAKIAAAPGKPFIEIDFCRGYCILVKRDVINAIGGLDEAYNLGYYDDDDFSIRAIRAGYRCVRANEVVVEHLGDSTFSSLFTDTKRLMLHEKNKRLFYSRWGRRMRIVFIVSGRVKKEKLSALLFSLARKQHILYVWNLGHSLGLEHINIREDLFPPFFPVPLFSLRLFLDRRKNRSRRYNLIFTDLSGPLWEIRRRVYKVDMEKVDRIHEIVDAASRMS